MRRRELLLGAIFGALVAVATGALAGGAGYNRQILKGNIYTAGQMYSAIATTLSPSAGTQTVDWDNGNVQYIDLESASATVTLTLSNPAAGAAYTIIAQQSTANPNRNLAWPGTVKFTGGVVPVVTAVADAKDMFYCTYDGSAYYCDQGADYR